MFLFFRRQTACRRAGLFFATNRWYRKAGGFRVRFDILVCDLRCRWWYPVCKGIFLCGVPTDTLCRVCRIGRWFLGRARVTSFLCGSWHRLYRRTFYFWYTIWLLLLRRFARICRLAVGYSSHLSICVMSWRPIYFRIWNLRVRDRWSREG